MARSEAAVIDTSERMPEADKVVSALLARRLREIKMERGYTNETLAKAIGNEWTPNNVGQYLRAERIENFDRKGSDVQRVRYTTLVRFTRGFKELGLEISEIDILRESGVTLEQLETTSPKMEFDTFLHTQTEAVHELKGSKQRKTIGYDEIVKWGAPPQIRAGGRPRRQPAIETDNDEAGAKVLPLPTAAPPRQSTEHEAQVRKIMTVDGALTEGEITVPDLNEGDGTLALIRLPFEEKALVPWTEYVVLRETSQYEAMDGELHAFFNDGTVKFLRFRETNEGIQWLNNKDKHGLKGERRHLGRVILSFRQPS